MLTPAETFWTRLPSKRTFRTSHQVHVPWELRGVNTIAQPACACRQWFSKMLFSTTTFRALFSSKRFLTVHTVAVVGAAPLVPASPVSMNSVPDTTQYCP